MYVFQLHLVKFGINPIHNQLVNLPLFSIGFATVKYIFRRQKTVIASDVLTSTETSV